MCASDSLAAGAFAATRGTGVAVVLVGLVNLLAEPTGRERPRSRSVVHAVNAVYLAYGAVLVVLAPSAPVNSMRSVSARSNVVDSSLP